SAIRVPGDKFRVKPELTFCHRFVYRTRVRIPADLAGRSFFLRFPSVNMIASLLVNGRFCGWTKAMYTLWECDVTPAIRPGEVNEISLVIKDAYYAFSPKKTGKSCRFSFNIPYEWIGTQNFVGQHFDFPVASEYAKHAGILEAPSLVAAGPVYTTDVFAIPSVEEKRLALEVTLRNPTAEERTATLSVQVLPAGGGPAQKTFAPREVRLPAGSEETVRLSESWEAPHLWWPDDPQLYDAAARILMGGAPIDIHTARFGFREWKWDGPQFRLNGVPWQLFADCTLNDGGKDPEAAIAYWRESGQNMWRFWGRTFGGLSKREALDLMDARGIIVRRSGLFDGQGANYLHGLADNRELFDNWIVQLTSQVREERNHPSILVWSIENEITFINSRNLGLSKRVEPEIARGGLAAMAIDPTRPAMVDGGNCLIDEALPVNGVHYLESFWRDYPDEAYTLAKAYVSHEKNVMPHWGKSPWRLVPDRPIFMGESYYLRGNRPADFAQFGGEGCFAGWSEHARRGAGLFAKMLAEGYRWHGVAAQHFWLGADDAARLHESAWTPVCVLCRQWNWTFAGDRRVPRTLKVFNGTRHADPIAVTWTISLAGIRAAGGTRTFGLAPGASEEFEIALDLPKVERRTAGEFTVACARGGKEVFRETKPIAVIDPDAGPKPAVSGAALAVVDPFGSAKARLTARGIPFVEIASAAEIPPGAKLVVIGKDALSPREATDPRWVSLAGDGARVIVLEQANPLEHLATPSDLAPTDHTGRVAFIENATHPAFEGLDQPDFFTWSGDHIVYRNAYVKASRGAASLVHCDDQLSCSALSECPVNDGLLVLCQLVVGEKLASDPVAQRLFDNLLAYAATYAPIRRRTAVAMDASSPAAKLLAESGLAYDPAPDVLSAIADGAHEIIVFDATRANLQALAGAPEKVKAFAGGGGWLMAWGLEPEGLEAFNRIVGVEHVLRPFELERVTLPAARDPLLSGLTGRDVAMESGEKIFSWAGEKYMVDDEFTYIVDLDEIAPFCAFPGAKAGDRAAAREKVADWPRNMVNGFTSADAWKLIHYLPAARPRVDLTLPRSEEIVGFAIVPNLHYARPTEVTLRFDGDGDPVVLPVRPANERQDFDIAPARRTKKISIEITKFENTGQITGIDNIWIRVARSDAWRSRVKPLLAIGGLVKYPMGKGGLVLNQLRILPVEANPVNARKKGAIATALLRNLHATFAGSRILTEASFAYRPIPLLDRANQYLTKDRGWFDGGRDLSHLPIGRNTFAGVTYEILDFKTSPVPSCAMLAGPGARGKMPQEVKGIPAGGKADALFFLHAFRRAAEWRRRNPQDSPPVIFRYIIHYADGETAEVPVIYGEGADHWVTAEPKGLKSAALAWAGRFPGDASPDWAAIYTLRWQNPRPDAEIATIDLAYGPAGSRYGTPALLAITAGTARESASAPAAGRFEGRHIAGEGDVEFLEMLDTARRMFDADPEYQSFPMLYAPAWNGFVEGPKWNAWWIQNSYGPTYCALPFFEEPLASFLANANALWFDHMGDGKKKFVWAGHDHGIVPDGQLCDAATPEHAIHKQGDGRVPVHDWGVEFTAAGLLMQAELLLIGRDPEGIARDLPRLERCADFLETRRDPKTNLFLAGPAGNLLAPSYAAVKNADGTFGMAYLAGLSVTMIAALDRLIEVEILAGRAEKAEVYRKRRDLAREGLPRLLTDEGYFIKYLEPDGTRHGVYGAPKYGYFEAVVNHDAISFGVVDDAQARKILKKIDAIPGLRPHGAIITNCPSLDDMYEEPRGLWGFGTWVNGGHWSTCEARMVMGYFRLGDFDAARRSMRHILGFARAFRMDNPLTSFGADVYFRGDPIHLCYDSFGAPAAMLRGLFEYRYAADRLTLLPHIPPSIARFEQRFPVRFGPKRLYLAARGAGPVTGVSVNGKPWSQFEASAVTLPFATLPDIADVRIALGGAALPDRGPLPGSAPLPAIPPPDDPFWKASWVEDIPEPNTSPLRIGADSNGGSRFAGEIAQPLVFGRALAAAEIAALARGEGEKLLGDASLAGNWRLDAPDGASFPNAAVPDMPAKAVEKVEVVERDGRKGIRLDGNGWVEVAHHKRLNLTKAYTLAAWVRPEALPQGGGRIIDKAPVGTSDGFLLDTHPGNSLRLITERGTLHFDAKLPVGRWSHVAGTFVAGGELRLFIDGKQAASAPAGAVQGIESFAKLGGSASRLRALCDRMAAAGLGDRYEAAHARLALEMIAAIRARAKGIAAGTIPALAGPARRAADVQYIDAAARLVEGLEKVLASYEKAEDPEKRRIREIWAQTP
ncbi:MAG: hypothetical protein JXP34_00675, partial [Planctomycetes bacterium]|nr:hypothetical protein [Planctomycetota bacterium]